MGKNRNRHKTKSKNVTDTPYTTLGDIMKAKGINIKEVKKKFKNAEKETN
jgi:ribosomal protein L11